MSDISNMDKMVLYMAMKYSSPSMRQLAIQGQFYYGATYCSVGNQMVNLLKGWVK
jgi:hypothetical protein